MVYDVNGNVLVQIDDTLTISGAAADAKATGDAVDELKSALSDISDSTRNINTSSAGRYSVDQNTGVITKNASSTTIFGVSEPVAIEPARFDNGHFKPQSPGLKPGRHENRFPSGRRFFVGQGGER